MTHKLLSRDCSYRQTQKGKYQVWEGDRQGGFIWTHLQRGRPSIKCQPTASSYDARCSFLQMVYTFPGEYFHKRSISAMVIIQKNSAWSHLHISNNGDWKIRLQSLDAKDARAINIKYNFPCYVRYVPRSETVIAPGDSDSNRTRIIAAEFYSLVQKALKEGKVFPITDVSTTYKAILESIRITNIATRQSWKSKLLTTFLMFSFINHE